MPDRTFSIAGMLGCVTAICAVLAVIKLFCVTPAQSVGAIVAAICFAPLAFAGMKLTPRGVSARASLANRARIVSFCLLAIAFGCWLAFIRHLGPRSMVGDSWNAHEEVVLLTVVGILAIVAAEIAAIVLLCLNHRDFGMAIYTPLFAAMLYLLAFGIEFLGSPGR